MKGVAFFVGMAGVWLAARPVQSQVVQLPTFHQFSVSTTVSVPDSGTMSLGGISSARESERAFGAGPLRSRAYGREMNASGATATARIMDLREMDEEVLSLAGSKRAPAERAALARAGRLTRGVERAGNQGPVSIAELRQQRAAEDAAKHEQVLTFIQKADTFRDQGKITTAKALYRMAWHRTTDEQVRRELKNRLLQLERR